MRYGVYVPNFGPMAMLVYWPILHMRRKRQDGTAFFSATRYQVNPYTNYRSHD